MNATKAYLELHPHVSYASARVLGSRALTKVNIDDVLARHNLDIATYMQQLYTGLYATKSLQLEDRIVKVPNWKIRVQYLELLGKLLNC